MEHTGNENIVEALKLLEEAAKQKKDELKTVMSDKYTHLKSLITENARDLMKAPGVAKDDVIQAVTHVKEAGVEMARKLARDSDKCAHENPWHFIAGSAAVGLVLGYILGRSRK